MDWATVAGGIVLGAGALLLVVGVLMVTGTFNQINLLLLQWTPDWLWSRL